MRYNSIVSSTTAIKGDQLTNALHVLGVHFVLGGQSKDNLLHKQPVRLIAALAESNESRLRLSLIPLFLEHPEIFCACPRSGKKNSTRPHGSRFNATIAQPCGWGKNTNQIRSRCDRLFFKRPQPGSHQ